MTIFTFVLAAGCTIFVLISLLVPLAAALRLPLLDAADLNLCHRSMDGSTCVESFVGMVRRSTSLWG